MARRSRACGSSSWRSGCSCRSPARCWPTGVRTSSGSSGPRATRTAALVTQGIGADGGGVNLSIALANRGKRSIALDLRTDGGQGGAAPAARERPTSSSPTSARARCERLGLDAEALTAPLPRLVYARGHGYGARGPDADQPGYDASAFWARGGLAHVLTPPDRDQPIMQRGAHRRPQRRRWRSPSGSPRRCCGATRTGRGLGRRRVAAGHRDVDAVVRRARARCRAAAPRAAGGRGAGRPTPWSAPTGPATAGTSSSSSSRPTATGPTSAGSSAAPTCVDDPRFADLAGPRREPRRLRRRARRRVRPPDLRGVEGAARRARRARGRRSRPSRSCSTTRRCVANGYVGEVAARRRRPAYPLPTGPVQFDETPPDLRRAPEHGEHTEAVLLELGYSGTRSPGSKARGPSRDRAPDAGPRRALGAVLGGRRPPRPHRGPLLAAAGPASYPPDLTCPACGSTDPAFAFEPVERARHGPVVDGRAPVVPARLRRRRAVRARRRRARASRPPTLRMIGRLLDGPDAAAAARRPGHRRLRGHRRRRRRPRVRAGRREDRDSAPEPGRDRRLRPQPDRAARRPAAGRARRRTPRCGAIADAGLRPRPDRRLRHRRRCFPTAGGHARRSTA